MSRPAQRQAQRGAATLVVVMVMFLVVAMLAAYGGRNLIFEQRVAANDVRAASAREAAEAGLEWGLAQLNAGKMDAACRPSSSGTDTFRDRYLSIDVERRITPRRPASGLVAIANCVRDAEAGWQCQCPPPGTLQDPGVNGSPALRPSFLLQFEPIGRNGVVRLLAKGCSDSALSVCNDLDRQQEASVLLLGASLARVNAALLVALKTPPAAPLTSRLAVTTDAQGVGLHNSDPRSGGLLLLTGAALPALPAERLDSLPGAAPEQALVGDDARLAVARDDRLFRQTFGIPPDAYSQQPTVQRIACAADCVTALAGAQANGVRVVWIEGDATLAKNLEIGTDDAPLLVVVNGSAQLTGPMILHGLLYVRGDLRWSNASGQPALLSGAAVVEGGVAISGRVDFNYQRAVLDRLANVTGSFVRLPGSYSDANR